MKPKVPVVLDVTHTTLAVICIGALLASSFWVLRPFLMSILWASLIVIATWPAMEKLQARLGGRRTLAVTIMTLTILLVVLVPLTLAVLTIVDHAEGIVARAQSLSAAVLPAPPQWIERIPFAGEKIAAKWRESAALGSEERLAMMAPYTGRLLQWFVDQAGSIGMTMLQFLLTTIIDHADGIAARVRSLPSLIPSSSAVRIAPFRLLPGSTGTPLAGLKNVRSISSRFKSCAPSPSICTVLPTRF